MTPAGPLPLLGPRRRTWATPRHPPAARPRRRLGPLRGAEPLEAVTLHDAGGALALAGADDVDLGHAVEHLGGQLLADRVLRRVLRAQLHQVSPRRHARLGEVPTLGLVHLARVDGPDAPGGGGGAAGAG